ncbi:MAG TPA: NAD(P)-dependent oxidoreductase [Acidobacteriaceae bacterium]|nr:NAD(P)-dependent oxidoreductase [Acidobacteriaceae bacterium]
MSHCLVTGGSGFFGGVLRRRLVAEGHTVVNVDLEPDEDAACVTNIRGDLRDSGLMSRLFREHKFDAVYHVAAQLAHGSRIDEKLLWTSNVDATRLLANLAAEHGVRPFIFISSNCLWAHDLGHPVREETDLPAPVEIYGRSKLAAEQALAEFRDRLDVVILRSPTIIESGRLGLLAILFEFIDDNKTVWVVGDGSNRYQFIYAEDLATACILAAGYGKSDLFHIGSDDVKSLRDVYDAVIRKAGSKSQVRGLPKGPTIAAMKLAYKLKMSPLGPYHYKMIAESFLFDTTRIKSRLGWKPTLTNEQMLLRAYEYYRMNRREIASRTDVSAHRKQADMGLIRVLKWMS